MTNHITPADLQSRATATSGTPVVFLHPEFKRLAAARSPSFAPWLDGPWQAHFIPMPFVIGGICGLTLSKPDPAGGAPKVLSHAMGVDGLSLDFPERCPILCWDDPGAAPVATVVSHCVCGGPAKDVWIGPMAGSVRVCTACHREKAPGP